MTEPRKSPLAPVVAGVALLILAGGLSALAIRSEAVATKTPTSAGTEPNAPATSEPQPL